MPFVIKVTDKQRANLTALASQVGAAEAQRAAYLTALMDGAEGCPAQYSSAVLTDDGLVLGDVPAAANANVEAVG